MSIPFKRVHIVGPLHLYRLLLKAANNEKVYRLPRAREYLVKKIKHEYRHRTNDVVYHEIGVKRAIHFLEVSTFQTHGFSRKFVEEN
ncbi:hypothetical protein AKO1_004709 [Acrasis kona]|uniref:Complex 1 LYR protein domain-containing protein n=1 Tax=Acrasis kona TaxID=1008807 RepID=A0AAW2Z4B7_9EUKA